jgi:hypothetical protein
MKDFNKLYSSPNNIRDRVKEDKRGGTCDAWER